jgi:hypothetical protein
MLYVQAVLAVVGIGIVALGRFRLGRHEVGNPAAPVVGWVLVAPLPISVFLWVILGVGQARADVRESVEEGARAQNGNRRAAPRPARSASSSDDYPWLAPVLSGLSLLIAGALTYIGAKEADAEPPQGEPAPPGPTPVAEVAEVAVAPSDALARWRDRPDGIRTGPAPRVPVPPTPTGFRPLTPDERPPAPLPEEEESFPVAVPMEVRRYRGAPNAVPPEVLALGRAERLHRPWPVVAFLHKHRRATVAAALALGLTMLLLPLLLGALPRRDNTSLFLLSLLGLAVAGLSLVPLGPLRSFAVYRDVLVVVEGDDFTVLPWDAVASVTFGDNFTTADGRKFSLHDFTPVEGARALAQTIQERVLDRLASEALELIEKGGSAVFGPFTVNATSLGYKGKTLLWEQVSHLSIQAPHRRGLNVGADGALLTWSCSFEGVPNDFVLLEVIRKVCPKRLLVPTSLRLP